MILTELPDDTRAVDLQLISRNEMYSSSEKRDLWMERRAVPHVSLF